MNEKCRKNAVNSRRFTQANWNDRIGNSEKMND